jgi:hypothetical protein
LSSLSPVSRWQRDHEGSRRNAIGEFRCGHGLCAGDGGRLGLNWPVPKYLLTELPLLSTLKQGTIDAFALSSPTSDVAVRTWRRVHAVQFPAAPQ